MMKKMIDMIIDKDGGIAILSDVLATYKLLFFLFCKILLPKVCLLRLGWAIPSDVICDSGFKLLRSRQAAGISRIHVQRKKHTQCFDTMAFAELQS